MSEELRFHLEQQIAVNVKAGMPPDEARRRARLQLGAEEGVKAECREERRGFRLESVWSDVRFGLRLLRKNPVFTCVAILTLALGIGATSAVFSAVDRILFRSLPYPQDSQLVSLGYKAPIEPGEFLAGLDFIAWRNAAVSFAQLTSMLPGSIDCDITERDPVRMGCAHVDADFLPTLGVRPILGRTFTKDEDRPHADRVALLSYGLWRTRYGSDPTIVGKSISLDGQPTQVIGVLPSDFEMPTLSAADLVVPEALDEAGLRPNGPQPILRAFARLKPGVTIPQARAALEPVYEQSLQFVPPPFRKEVSLGIRSLRDSQVQDAKTASWVLLGSVLAVLLLACTNVTNLLLARATIRRRELAVRAALGANSTRLARQALTESLVLSILGGVLGCWVAYGLLRLFVSIAPDGIPHLRQAALDPRVLVFTLGVAIASGVVFGIAPAWRSPEPGILVGKEVHATSHGALRPILVTAQIAISLILLTGAGLLLRSLWNLQSVPLGLNAQNVVAAEITLAQYRYPQRPQQHAFFEQLLSRVRQIPGVSSAAIGDSIPPLGGEEATIFSNIEVAGRPRQPQGTGGMVGWRAVTPGYFAALGTPILEGRAFRDEDLQPSNNPIILSSALARRLFPGEDPIGKNLRLGLDGPWRNAVGIAADVSNNGLEMRGDPEYYVPWTAPEDYGRAHVIVRTPVNSQTMESWLRSAVASVDPAQPVTIETMRQRVSKLADRPRFSAVLLALFALMGVALAAIGMYGVVGFLVAQRTREIGVRMALGASPRAILALVLGSVARWTAAGAIVGLAGSWFATRLLQSLLFHVPAHDPALFAFAIVALTAVAFVAGWIPARRAMRVDPMIALRYE
jgi:putative ABC transport system permease protein